jgi:hypothetical protein
VLGIVAGLDAHDRLGEPASEIVLVACAPGAKHVERNARDHRREPAAEVRNGLGVRSRQTQPRLLDRVLGLAHRPEHPVGDGPQVSPVSLELVCHQVVLAHRHILSLHSVIHLTNDQRPM